MGYIRIEAMGSEEVQRALDRVGDIPEMAAQALQAGANVLLPIEQAAAPVRSDGSHIKNRLEIRLKGGGSRPTAEVGVWDEPIAYYVEYGHGGPHPAPAHPYMAPAAESAEDAVMAAILGAITAFMEG